MRRRRREEQLLDNEDREDKEEVQEELEDLPVLNMTLSERSLLSDGRV